MAAFDAVFVGAGINSLAECRAALEGRLERLRPRAERRPRRAASGPRPTSRLPGFTHEVLASWHPLFTGSPAYAELQADLDRARARVPEHRASDRLRVPGRVERLPHDVARGQRRRARASCGRRTAPPGRRCSQAFMENADLSFGVLGTELWSPAGLGLGRQALRRFGRRGLLAYAGERALELSRLARRHVRVGCGARAARALGAAHRASAPIRRRRAS